MPLSVGHSRIHRPAADHRSQASRVSVEAEHGEERLIDGPHLVGCQLSDTTPEPLGVDGADLFDKHPSRVSSD